MGGDNKRVSQKRMWGLVLCNLLPSDLELGLSMKPPASGSAQNRERRSHILDHYGKV